MRKTLHEYVIELSKEYRNDFDCAFRLALSHAKLTNKAPKLGDFIGKDAIFKGDWEVEFIEGDFIYLKEVNRISINYDKANEVFWIEGIHYKITRIEDLPREIEFKEEVI